MEERNRWILLIKELRARHGTSILEAERIALSDPNWRRWVERRLETDAQCRRMGLRHIRLNGADALLVRDGDLLKVR